MMNSNLEISIIIPAYNEERRIQKCLKRVLEYCNEQKWNFEIIVAEDGSNDNTVKIVQEFILKDERIKLLSCQERLGKGRAIRNAMFHVAKNYVCFLDVDLSADISELQRLLKYKEDYDIVVGSRLLRDNLPHIKTTYRTIFSHMYSKIFGVLFRTSIIDPQCGFKFFKTKSALKLFKEINTTGFAFDSEVIVKGYWLDLKIKEVPIIWNYDTATKVSVLKQIREMGKDILLIWYESHLMWLQNKPTYPQKRGSRKARLFFAFLSLFFKTKS